MHYVKLWCVRVAIVAMQRNKTFPLYCWPTRSCREYQLLGFVIEMQQWVPFALLLRLAANNINVPDRYCCSILTINLKLQIPRKSVSDKHGDTCGHRQARTD